MAAYEVLLLNTAIPQIQAAQSGDTYVVPRDIAINATAIISANSATDALRITQTGTGNALLVEDSANPDSTPFVVTAAGDVGIGASGPAYKLDAQVASNVRVARFKNTSSTVQDYTLFAANDSDTIIGMGVYGSAAGATGMFGANSPFITASAELNLGATSGSGVIKFASGGTAEKMRLDSSGNLGLGATPSPWQSSWKTFAIGDIGRNLASTGTGAGDLTLVFNGYRDATDNRWEFSYAGDYATRYSQTGTGVHSWHISTAVGANANDPITFTQAMTLDASGNLKLGGTADRATTAGTNHLDIFNGTAPVGTLANGISIYSAAGEAYVMDAAGNATLFSPHDAETNEWIFKSKHTPTGKVLKIDVERLLKFVNDHFGLDAVHEFVEE